MVNFKEILRLMLIRDHWVVIGIILLVLVGLRVDMMGQPQLWNITRLDEPSAGYVKFDIGSNGNFFLLDNYGNRVHVDSNAVYRNNSLWKILRNGNWSCYKDSAFKILNEDLELLDTVRFPENYDVDIHDLESLDNGHYLLLGMETRTMDLSAIVDGGRVDAQVEAVVLLEVDGDGNIYWTWNSFNYFDIRDVTDDIDLTQPRVDFTHTNAIAVDLDGNILICSRHLDEITKINKATGEIIWRWGGSECSNNEFVFVNDTINGFYGFSHQHAIQVLANGNYLMFDNGNLKPSRYSRAVEYSMNVGNGTVTKVWEYVSSPVIYKENSGNAQRLSNGNTLINWSEDKISEVNADKQVKLEISIIPDLSVYRVLKYITKMNAMTRSITGGGLYDFNGGEKEETKVKINISTLSGTGSLTVEKHDYAPPTANYSDTNFTSIMPYRWVLSKSGITNINGNLRIGVTGLSGISEPSKLYIFKRDKETSGTFQMLTTSYSTAMGELSANITGFGEVILCSYVLGNVILSEPVNNSYGVGINGILRWQKVKGASNYRVQISTDNSFENVVDDGYSGVSLGYQYYGLNYNTQYFWRVMAMSSKDSSDWSNVGQFTTELQPPFLIEPANNYFGAELKIRLSWNVVGGAAKYWLEVAKDSLFGNIFYTNRQAINQFEIINLTQYDEMFYWRVRAYRTSDTSKWSDVWNFTTVLPAPFLSEPVNYEINADIMGKLKWENIINADSYSLQLALDSVFSDIFYNENNVIFNKFEYDSLSFNSEYFWRVRSVRITDSSDWSKIFRFSTILAPVNLIQPKDSAEELENEILFKWSNISNAEFYEIQISGNLIFQNLILDRDSINTNEMIVSSLPFEKQLYWRVRAETGLKHGKWSKIFMFTTAPLKQLAKPALIKPSNNAKELATSGYFTWHSIEGAKSFELQVSKDNTFKNIYKSYIQEEDTNLLFSDYDINTQYFWRVRAVNNLINSEWSEIWNFTTSDNSSYPEIVLTEPPDAATKVDINGILQWEAVTVALSYHIQISKVLSFNPIIIDESNLSNNYYSYDDMDFNMVYYWRVGAEYENHSIRWSEIRSFVTELRTPNLIKPLDKSTDNGKDGLLSWTEIEGATGYDVRLSDDSLFTELLISSTNHGTYEKTYNLADSMTYFWQVKAVTTNNESKWSYVYGFMTNKTTDVETKKRTIDYELTPNPVWDILSIKINTEVKSNITISIINVLGDEIFTRELKSREDDILIFNIDLNIVPTGIYILLVDNGLQKNAMKFIKN